MSSEAMQGALMKSSEASCDGVDGGSLNVGADHPI